MRNRKYRVAYLVTHPIPYQAPLLRRISQDQNIDLTVFFCSDFSIKKFNYPGFDVPVEWDIPLLDGYRYEFLPALGIRGQATFWKPFNYGLSKRLKAGQFDALWIHGYARGFHWIAILIAKFIGMKVMIRDEATPISTPRGLLKRIAKRVFLSGLNLLCDGFLAISTLNRTYYSMNGIKDEKIFMMPYAVDNKFFQEKSSSVGSLRDSLRASLKIEDGRLIILYAGRLMERKRPIDLLEAYIKLSPDGIQEPRPYLLFIGEGEMRTLLEKRTGELGWKTVKFLGFKNQTELPQFYDLSDIFVLPSIYEPFGLAVNEAMNERCAIIVSDQVGCGPDLVKNGKNGYIVDAMNIESLHQALDSIAVNPGLCHSMGEMSLNIINRWSFEEDVQGLKNAIKYICKD